MFTVNLGSIRGSGRGKLCIAVVLFCSIQASLVWAQLPTATILGVVRDASGAVVPGVSLTARHVDTGQTRTTVSGGDGSYRLPALPVGSYEVRAEQSGFQTAIRSGLTLTVAQEAVVNFALEVGAVTQTIAVTAEAPMVNTTSGSLGWLVNEQQVADLPLNGRNYIDLTLLQPGVSLLRQHAFSVAGFTGTWFSSNGAPLRGNNLMLDGAPMITFHGVASSSVSGSTLGLDGIREYQVMTNSFSAEYGITMGSQTMMVSKGGTNTFHGSLFEYLRNSALDARNFFDRKTAANQRRLPNFVRNNFGGAFGGPLKKDKTFFFGVYEGLKERLGATFISNVIPASAKVDGGVVPIVSPVVKPLLALLPNPNLPGTTQFAYAASQPTDEQYGQMRVDQTFSSADTLFVRYTVDDANRIRPYTFPKLFDFVGTRAQYATLSETHIFSPSLLSTFRFSLSRTRDLGESPTGISGPGLSFVEGHEIGSFQIGGVANYGVNNTHPYHTKQNIFSWSDDLFYTRGRHSLKFGTLINRYQQYSLFNLNLNGGFSFNDVSDFLQAQRPKSITALTPGSITDRTHHYSSLGFYVQDDLRLSSNLTINLGLRYEPTTQRKEVSGHGAVLRDLQHDAKTTVGPDIMRNPSWRNLSPRFGFAWDVRGDGKTAVRGGFALLYEVSALGSADVTSNAANPPFSNNSSVANAPTITIPLVLPPESVGKSLGQLDYNMQQPHILQYNSTVERQLPFEMGLRLTYAGSRGLNLYQWKEGNPTVPQGIPVNGVCVPSPVPIQPDRRGPKCWTGTESRTNPNWEAIQLTTAAGNSWYNSFQLGLNKRLSKGLQFQSSYTWAKLIDDTTAVCCAEASIDNPVDPTDRKYNRGLANFDIAHNLRFNALYNLPDLSKGGTLGKILNGWRMSGILAVQDGNPIKIVLSANRSRSKTQTSISDRPDLVPGRSKASITHSTSTGCGNIKAGTPVGTHDLWYDPCAFAIPPAGFLGNAPRNFLRGPGFASVDFSLIKETALRFLGENGSLEFRAEVFNIFNRTNLYNPSGTVYAGTRDVESPLPTAGTFLSAGGSQIGGAANSRQIQLGLRLSF